MSDFKLVLHYLRTRVLVTGLITFSIALGVALALIVLLLADRTQRTLMSETAACDIVVSAKGSPLQTVLNGIYFLDQPTGNVNISIWQRLRQDPGVKRVIPLTMGDNYYGMPIVGTVPDYFSERRLDGGNAGIARGRMFTKPFEMVVGAEVAAHLHLTVGQQIIGAHGWGRSNDFHPRFPYTITGILAPTGASLDRALFTDYHSTWIVHSHPDADEAPEPGHDPTKEITSLLVQLHQPGLRFRLVQDINAHENAMAAVPVDEMQKVSSTFIAPLQSILLLVAYLVILVSALTILISLYLLIHQRRRDIAVIRSLGATQGDVFRLVTLEAALLSGIGILAGWALAHGLAAAIGPAAQMRFGIDLQAWQVQPFEGIIVGSVWVLGILAGLLPASAAYRFPVADILVQE